MKGISGHREPSLGVGALRVLVYGDCRPRNPGKKDSAVDRRRRNDMKVIVFDGCAEHRRRAIGGDRAWGGGGSAF
jgi:hypothetical protein